MKILSIETSCDETAISLIEAEGGKDSPDFSILKNALYSQASKHAEFGGVFPSLAKREHAKNLVPLLSEIITEIPTGSNETPDQVRGDIKDVDWSEIEELLHRETDLAKNLKNFVLTHEKPEVDMLAVTSGPGLEPALWVGINFAKALSIIWQIPLMPVNHMEGHIVSVLTESKVDQFPSLALLISGGHTEIVLVKNWGDYEITGKTKDDAIGEAYDKVARIINLPYPGGPEISKLAKTGRESNECKYEISFPRPMIGSKDYDFSLSGLKTAVLYRVQKFDEIDETVQIEVATEFEQAIVDVLKKKVGNAIEEFGVKNLIVGGGVIANEYIRESLSKISEEKGVTALFPSKDLSTDNAIMIGMAGYLKSLDKNPEINPEIRAEGNLSLED